MVGTREYELYVLVVCPLGVCAQRILLAILLSDSPARVVGYVFTADGSGVLACVVALGGVKYTGPGVETVCIFVWRAHIV